MRLVAWGCAFGLAACQLVAGITDGSSGGPCTKDSECPDTETCVEDHCKAKGASSGGGSGAKAGGGGMSGVAGGGGRTGTGGSSGQGGSSASGGGSGMSQAGAAAVQGGDGGRGGASAGGSSAGGDSGDAGDGGAGDTSGTGGGGTTGGDGAGGRGTGGDGAGAGGAGGGGAGGGGAGSGGAGGSAGMAAGAGGSGGMAGTGGAGPVRIMPLGDGITASTCMRAFLWKKLTDNAYPAFDFVGTRTSADACDPTEYDKNNEGHSSYRVSDLLSATSLHTDTGDTYTGSSADLAAWFDGRPADIVLMLFGSNDFLNKTSSSAADVQNAYSAILAKLRSVNSHVTLLVALLPPMRSDKCNTSCATKLSDLNDAIPSWATTASSPDSRVVVVDMTAFDVTNTTDGIKPDDIGAQFLADRWYEALDAL